EFPLSPSLKRLKTCLSCLKKQAAIRSSREDSQKEKENIPPHDHADTQKLQRPSTLSWNEFLSLLRGGHGYPHSIDAFVEELPHDPLCEQNVSDRATTVSKAIWEATGYRFK